MTTPLKTLQKTLIARSNHLFTCSLILAFSSLLHAETVYFNGKDFKGGYAVVPDEMPKDGTKMWVIVDAHGAGGLRNEGMGHRLKKALEPAKVIFIVPSFTSGFQGGSGKWADQMIENFKLVQKRYSVHDKMFVHAHSGGGQFAHRFAFTQPKYVVGVSAHSSGSWACSGGYGTISTKAKGIPFAISCGEKDTKLSVASSAHNRITWYKLFNEEMKKKGFVVAGSIWPGAGHGVSTRQYTPQLKECFLLATQGVLPTSDLWSGEDLNKIAQAAQKEYGTTAPDISATMRFLAKYPASLWVADEKLTPLKNHCKKSAESYLKEQKKAGTTMSGRALTQFKKATDGLEIEI